MATYQHYLNYVNAEFPLRKLLNIESLHGKVRVRRARRVNIKSTNTTPELKVQEILKSLGVSFKTQQEVNGKFFDIYIPAKNLLIEVDGEYWHGHNVTFSNKNKMQRRSFKNDLRKDGIATLYGYTIKRIWESEITIETVKKLLE